MSALLFLRTTVMRTSVLGGCWGVLSEWQPKSLLWGVPFVAASVALSFRLVAPKPPFVRPWEAVHFLFFFARGSLAGGMDVAKRALSPSLPLHPRLVPYSMQLPPGAPQLLFRLTLNLMPGTLSAEVEGDAVTVHALADPPEKVTRELRALEARVRRLFGLPTTTEAADA